MMDWQYTGFALVIIFIEHFQNVITNIDRAVPNSHTLQFTAARTKFIQSAVSSPVVAW
jgi:hypothetical protein